MSLKEIEAAKVRREWKQKERQQNSPCFLAESIFLFLFLDFFYLLFSPKPNQKKKKKYLLTPRDF